MPPILLEFFSLGVYQVNTQKGEKKGNGQINFLKRKKTLPTYRYRCLAILKDFFKEEKRGYGKKEID